VNDFSHINFPLHIMSFNGYSQPNNPNIKKIRSSTRTWDLPDGITVKLVASPYSGYAKAFHCYGVKRYQKPHDAESYIIDKAIMKMYYYKERGEWICYLSGGASSEIMDKLDETRKFILEYSKQFKS
jgi:hypothetical protein